MYESFNYGSTWTTTVVLSNVTTYRPGHATAVALSADFGLDPNSGYRFYSSSYYYNGTLPIITGFVQDKTKPTLRIDGSLNVAEYVYIGKDIDVSGNINLSGAVTLSYATAPTLQTQLGYATEASGNLVNYTSNTNVQPITGWTTGTPKTFSSGVWMINYYIYGNDSNTFNITKISSGLSTTTSGAYTWNVRELYYKCPATFTTIASSYDFCTQVTGILIVTTSTSYTFDVNLSTSVNTSDWNFNIKAVRIG